LSREEASRQLARVSHLPLLINDITFKLDKGGKEVVRIHANRLFEPAVFAIEGDQPRFVIDIKDPIVPRTPPAKLLVNGRFIKRIRTHLQQVPRRLRIVLDLHPLEDYMVNQLFYRAENIYALEVAKERK
ncbi:MAG: AMIN domain-containing protein, partial [Desulfobacteraceae bacterium]